MNRDEYTCCKCGSKVTYEHTLRYALENDSTFPKEKIEDFMQFYSTIKKLKVTLDN